MQCLFVSHAVWMPKKKSNNAWSKDLISSVWPICSIDLQQIMLAWPVDANFFVILTFDTYTTCLIYNCSNLFYNQDLWTLMDRYILLSHDHSLLLHNYWQWRPYLPLPHSVNIKRNYIQYRSKIIIKYVCSKATYPKNYCLPNSFFS